MDATRKRRLKDPTRRAWYAAWRARRFARRLGFAAPPGRTKLPTDKAAG